MAEQLEVRQIVSDALIGMITAVTGMAPPREQEAPQFIQSAIDRAAERIGRLLADHERDKLPVDDKSHPRFEAGYAAGLHDRELAATHSEDGREVKPEWGSADTVGNLIAQLRTMDPAMPLYASLRLADGRVKVKGLVVSYEWLSGQFIARSDDAERVAVMWTNPQEDIAQPARQVGGGELAEVPHLIMFDDAEVKPILFAGSGSREAALAKFEQVSTQWKAHLFVRVTKNCRDDRYPCATLAPAAVVMPTRANVLRGTSEDMRDAEIYNDALDEVTRLNRRAIPVGLLERICADRSLTPGHTTAMNAIDELRALLGKDGEVADG